MDKKQLATNLRQLADEVSGQYPQVAGILSAVASALVLGNLDDLHRIVWDFAIGQNQNIRG